MSRERPSFDTRRIGLADDDKIAKQAGRRIEDAGGPVATVGHPHPILDGEDAARVGPIRTQAQDVVDLLGDPDRCQVVLVTLPEEMPAELDYRDETMDRKALRRLKVEHVVALPPERLLHEGSYVWQGDEGNVAASYVITPGFGQPSGASLCPGGSGDFSGFSGRDRAFLRWTITSSSEIRPSWPGPTTMSTWGARRRI